MEAFIKELDQLVLEKKQRVTAKGASLHFNIHIEDARELLSEYAKNKKQDVKTKYLIVGEVGSQDDEIPLVRLKTVENEDIEEEKKAFTVVNSCLINSVEPNDEEDNHTTLPLDLPIGGDIEAVQRLTYIVNDNVTYRQEWLGKYQVVPNQTQTETKSKVQEKPAIKEEPKKVLKKTTLGFARMNKEQYEESKKIKEEETRLAEEQKKTEEKRKAEEQRKAEEKRKNEENIKSKLVKKSSLDDIDFQEDMEDQEEESSNKKKTENKQTLKRSKSSHTSSEEMDSPVSKKENQQKKRRDSKKHKRIRVMDSSSDEEMDCDTNDQKPSIEHKSSIEQKSTISEREVNTLVEETETYKDEDGYLVTRKVKKMVPKMEKFEVKSEVKKSPADKNPLNKKMENVSPEEKKSHAKKAPGKVVAGKNGQTSILKFFSSK